MAACSPSAFFPSYGGYNYSFVNEITDKFTCSICESVFKDPHITGCCGQVFCESCLNNWFSQHAKESCPLCRAEGEEFQHFLDKRLKREIDSLRIHCTKKEEGCQWIGELRSLKDHLESANGCDHVYVACTNGCETVLLDISVIVEIVVKKVKRKDLKNHLENECYLRAYQCEFCGHKDTYQRITGKNIGMFDEFFPHYYTCAQYTMECPNKCGVKDIKRKDVKDHRSQCPKEPLRCPFQEAGCKKKLVRHELGRHLSATLQQHLLMVMGAYKEMKKENRELKQANKKMKKDFEELKDRLEAVEEGQETVEY